MRSLSARSWLIAGTSILFVGRLIPSIVLPRSGPLIVADEIGYLLNARVLAGGVRGQLDHAAFYRGGYSLLLAPLLKLSSDPEVVYHLVLVLNAALAASVFPLLYLLLTRFAGIAPRTAIWAALAGAAYPAITVQSQVAWSENALFPLVCVWLIAFGGVLGSRTLRSSLLWAAGLGASAAGLWMVHNRMIAAVAATGVIIAWLGMRRRLHPAAALTVFLVLGAGIWATHALDAFLLDQNWVEGVKSNDLADRVSALFHGHAPLTVAANLLGQTWYLVVSTFGLAVVVLAAALTSARRARSADPEAREDPLPPVVPILLTLTALLLLISAAAFPVRDRVDMLIYGRYVEVVSPALIALGLAMLARHAVTPRMFRPMMAFALFSAAVVLIRVSTSYSAPASRWNVAGLPFGLANAEALILVGAALVAGGGAWLLSRLALREPELLGPVALALFLPMAVYGVWNLVPDSQRAGYPRGWTSPESVADANRIDVAAYDLDHFDSFGLYAVQWFLPDTSLRLFHGGRQVPPSRYVLSTRSWSRDHPNGKPTLLWSEAGRDQALWELQNPQARRLSRSRTEAG